MRLFVGACSWADKELIGSGWYPREIAGSPSDRLRFYSSHLECVEVNSTFYSMPRPEVVYGWLANTPPGFRFGVKVFALFSAHTVPASALPPRFRRRVRASAQGKGRLGLSDLDPEDRLELIEDLKRLATLIHDAGKLGYLLLQLAPWVGFSQGGLRYLSRLRRALLPFRLAVEFRNPSWFAADNFSRTRELLEEEAIALVCADQPQGERSVPPVLALTASWGTVVRLHGRDPGAWMGPRLGRPPTERFKYLYADEEIIGWLERAKRIASQGAEVYLMFNNCYKDYAVRNALRAKEIAKQIIG